MKPFPARTHKPTSFEDIMVAVGRLRSINEKQRDMIDRLEAAIMWNRGRENQNPKPKDSNQ